MEFLQYPGLNLRKITPFFQNTTTDKVDKYTLNNLTPFTEYEISVASENKHGFSEETKTSFSTLEEGEI